MQQRFFELLREENKKGITIFFSSHILPEVQKLCGRVAFIKEGKIIKIEAMSTLHENNYKKIHLETSRTIPLSLFETEGVSKPETGDYTADFIYKGNINTILQHLSNIELSNLSIGEPDLEEIFLHYYEKEGPAV